MTVASFAVVLVLWQRGPPEHCKQYQIRVHKKIAITVSDTILHHEWPVDTRVVRPHIPHKLLHKFSLLLLSCIQRRESACNAMEWVVTHSSNGAE